MGPWQPQPTGPVGAQPNIDNHPQLPHFMHPGLMDEWNPYQDIGDPDMGRTSEEVLPNPAAPFTVSHTLD